jgi:hypothetical protein
MIERSGSVLDDHQSDRLLLDAAAGHHWSALMAASRAS